MALAISEVRGIVERIFARQDVLAACAKRDLGEVIKVLSANGVTQGQIAELTGISQGRLSEWVRRKRVPKASSTFEAFAEGLGVPAAARQALGLAPWPSGVSGSTLARSSLEQSAPPAETPGAPSTAPLTPVRISGDSLADLQGLESVQAQIRDVLTILEAEQRRRNAGSVVKRRAWKNLVFAGGPGSGKSRTAAAVGRTYRELGLLDSGHVLEVSAVDLVGSGAGGPGTLLSKALKPATGGILLINGAHEWYLLPDHGQQVARQLYGQLSEYRNEILDGIAVILAGQASQLMKWLHGYPPLAARFQAVIEFPGYTPEQLATIFSKLADEAGLRLTAGAKRRAATVLAQCAGGKGAGGARLAVGLLNQAKACQARRVGAAPSPARDLATLVTIIEADIPQQVHSDPTAPDEEWPGLYL